MSANLVGVKCDLTVVFICISLVRLDIFSYSSHLVSSLVTCLFKSFSYWLVGGLYILWTLILCWYCMLEISSPSPWLSFIFTLFWWEAIEGSWIYQHFPLWQIVCVTCLMSPSLPKVMTIFMFPFNKKKILKLKLQKGSYMINKHIKSTQNY